MMNTQKLVFVTPLDDREVEVDTDELCAAGEPPHRVCGGLAEAARFVVARYPGHWPLLLSEKAAGSLEADALVEAFEQARRAALAAQASGGNGAAEWMPLEAVDEGDDGLLFVLTSETDDGQLVFELAMGGVE
jgi:hypothetical protein